MESDYIHRTRLRTEKLKAEQGMCLITWRNRAVAEEPDHPMHKCNRFKGHGSSEACNCGAHRTNKKAMRLGRTS